MQAVITTGSIHGRTLSAWGYVRVPGKMLALPNLARVREAKLRSQYELAREASVARATIARIERGEPARYGTIRKLAAALGVAPAELLGE